jgi:hypothetical protein
MGAKGLISESILTDIADAIRAKSGSQSGITPNQMASQIENLPSGGGLPEGGGGYMVWQNDFGVGLGNEFSVSVVDAYDMSVGYSCKVPDITYGIAWADETKTSGILTYGESYPQTVLEEPVQTQVEVIGIQNAEQQIEFDIWHAIAFDTSHITLPEGAVPISNDELSHFWEVVDAAGGFHFDIIDYETKNSIYRYDFSINNCDIPYTPEE